jgi:hypothetical protein
MSPEVNAVSAGPNDGARPDVVDALLALRSTAPEYVGSGWSGTAARELDQHETTVAPREVHRNRVAVTRSLGWAQESADRGDYLDALGWIGVVDEIGAELTAAFEIKRRAWSQALLAAERRGSGRRG